ncbi:MAG: hypothetical protein HY784_10080 [Chloroflexi bacterium]|nr:hypothetical protein [Chloroflexota bacterium]
METTLTLTLSPDLKVALEDATRQEGLEPGELVSAAIRQYLFLRRFRLLRERMIPRAEQRGIYTDQDVFDRVS